MKKLFIISILLILIASCSIEKKFAKLESMNLSKVEQNDTLSRIDSLVMNIHQQQFCKKKNYYSKAPKLEYRFIRNYVKISQFENLGKIFDDKNHFFFRSNKLEAIFEDSLITPKCKCASDELTVVSLPSKKTKHISGRLKRGFGSVMQGKKLNSAVAILESHYSTNNFVSPINIQEIQFNAKLDTALFSVKSTYGFIKYLITKENEKWGEPEMLYKQSQ